MRAFVILGGQRDGLAPRAGHGPWHLALEELGEVDFVLDVLEGGGHMYRLGSLLPRGLAGLIWLRPREMTCRLMVLL